MLPLMLFSGRFREIENPRGRYCSVPSDTIIEPSSLVAGAGFGGMCERVLGVSGLTGH